MTNLRTPLGIRPVVRADVDQLAKWLTETGDNLGDPDIFSYPSTRVQVAERNGKTIAYMPSQRVTMLESLAINPDATGRETALALAELTRAELARAKQDGISEVYFVCQHPETAAFAARHGFEELPYRTFRMKVVP